jgi:hypothetical protein
VGLYLCIFDEDEEIAGVSVGSYADFAALREYISFSIDGARKHTNFTTLMTHTDSDGEWSPAECAKLISELGELASIMSRQPHVAFASEWQRSVARSRDLTPSSALESFIDVDGNFLINSLLELASLAVDRKLPIVFQ